MGASLIRSFAGYLDKVFHFQEFLAGVSDRRRAPRIDGQRVVKGVVYGTVFRLRALAAIERECRTGLLKKRVGPFSDDTAGYVLDRLDPASLRRGWFRLARLMKRNGWIRTGRFGSLVVGVVDAIETLASYRRHCDRCLVRQVKVADGTVPQYYHRVVVLCLSGYAAPIPVDLELLAPGEGEVECALRLLARVRQTLGARFLDLVIGDALYCTPAFFDGCRALGVAAGAVLKDNQPEFLGEARQQQGQSAPTQILTTATESARLWDLPQVDWATAGRDMRVILAERVKILPLPRQRPEDPPTVRNAFAFSPDGPFFSTAQAFAIGRHRWDIDAALFQDLTRNWFLKHPTLHFPTAYENLLILRLVAFFLFTFFAHRHINSRRRHPIPSLQLASLLYQAAARETEPDYPLRL